MTWNPPHSRDAVICNRIVCVDDMSDYKEFCRKWDRYCNMAMVCALLVFVSIVVGCRFV